MNYYSVYGLVAQSEISLPEMQEQQPVEKPDLVIRFGSIKEPIPERGANGRYTRITPTTFQSYWPYVGQFLAIAGHEIIVDTVPDAREDMLRLVLGGPMLGVILHQRGFLVLHASSIALGAYAIGFLGASGWGKSTMAGALLARNHQLVADDVTPVHLGPDGPLVYSGFPQLKLWPDAAFALGDDPSLLPRLSSGEEKRARRVANGVVPEPLPLKILYVLAVSDQPCIETLSFQEAFVELVRHSYSAGLLVSSGSSKPHFQQCGKLIDTVPVRRLSRPRDINLLPEVAVMIEADALELAQADTRKAY